MKHIHKKRGQALTEYVLIALFVGLVVAAASTDLFGAVKHNYYQGMLPISNSSNIPEPPENSNLKPRDNKMPVAKIKGPTKGHIGSEITFIDESYDPDGFVKETNWGRKTLVKTFTEEGQHTVVLEVVDNDGNTDKVSFTINIGNDAPLAILEVMPDKVLKQGDGVSVSGSKSYDADGDTIESWEWFMTTPNGQRTSKNWPLTGNSFAPNELGAGKYKFELRVKDSLQKWSSMVTKTVNFNGAPSDPIIAQNPTGTIKTDQFVKITASGSVDPDGDPVSYIWSGRIAETAKYPSGKHTVTVKAVDSHGNESNSVGVSFYVLDPETGTGGVVLEDSNTTIIEILPAGTTATGYTFNVPAVPGHSGADYAYVKAYNKHTGQWDEIVRRSTSNGILLTGPLQPGKYTKVEFFYYATHCMYGKSNITYSVDFEFDRTGPLVPTEPTNPGPGTGIPLPTDPKEAI